MSKQIILFVGPHRSGSNFLNNHILPFIPGVFTAYTRDPELNYILLNAMEGHPLYTDYDAIRAKIDARLENIDEDIVLIGDEEFFGDYCARSSGGRYRSIPFHDHEFKIDLLSRVLDNPKVFLTIRRQDKWVESAYMHFIHNYYSIRFEDFIDPHRRSRGSSYKHSFEHRSLKPSCDYRMLDWSVYLENCYKKFGRENVQVIPNEMMAQDLPKALERLYTFMGVEDYDPGPIEHTNRSLSKTALKLALVFNRFVRTRNNPLGIIPEAPFQGWVLDKRRKKDNRLLWFLNGIIRRVRLYWFLSEVVSRINYQRPDPMSPKKRTEILEYFKDSNKKYADMIGLDLSKYGYY